MEKKKVYGFQVGESFIDVEAVSEQKAMEILVKKFWSFISISGKVELLGKRTTKSNPSPSGENSYIV